MSNSIGAMPQYEKPLSAFSFSNRRKLLKHLRTSRSDTSPLSGGQRHAGWISGRGDELGLALDTPRIQPHLLAVAVRLAMLELAAAPAGDLAARGAGRYRAA